MSSTLRSVTTFHLHKELPTITMERDSKDQVYWRKLLIRLSTNRSQELLFFGTPEQLDEVEKSFEGAIL